ncbi:MAG: CPBP family intramembrane metalloprotease [Eubacterium sp.]|nr:CPBP family intramembrane metalloprotease [Eubacterium sp.]
MKKREKIWDVLYPFIWMMLAVIAATIVASVIAALVTGVRIADADELSFVPLFASALFYVAVLVFQRRRFQLEELRFWADAGAGSVKPACYAAAVAAAIAGADLLERIISLLGLYQMFPLYETEAVKAFRSQNIPLLVVVTVILAPIAEELMFRGMVYRRIRGYLGNGAGIVLSALLFGLYHMNMIQLLYAFVLGLFFAWIYGKTRTLAAPVLCHAAANASALLIEYLVDQPGRITGSAISVLMAAEAAVAAAGIFYLLRN